MQEDVRLPSGWVWQLLPGWVWLIAGLLIPLAVALGLSILRPSDDGFIQPVSPEAVEVHSENQNGDPAVGNKSTWGSAVFCSQLAEVGRTAFNAKQDGNGIDAVLSVVRSGLAHDRRRQTAAEGVVLVIYGDSSITSGLDAYAQVYDACRQNS